MWHPEGLGEFLRVKAQEEEEEERDMKSEGAEVGVETQEVAITDGKTPAEIANPAEITIVTDGGVPGKVVKQVGR